jgi:hypothetical protein
LKLDILTLQEKDNGGVTHPTSGILKKDGRQGNPAAQPLGFFRQVTAAKSTLCHFQKFIFCMMTVLETLKKIDRILYILEYSIGETEKSAAQSSNILKTNLNVA